MPRLRFLTMIGAAATAALLSSMLTASATAAAAVPGTSARVSFQAGPGFSAVPTAGGSDHRLNGDSCPDTTFCMAVGNYHNVDRIPGLSEMLSAGNWVVERVLTPAQGSNVFANEVSCSSATNCLFVGVHWASHGKDSNLAEAWDGSKWQFVTTTRTPGATFSSLNDVACPTASFCLAIGDAGTSAQRYHDTAYTWKNSTTWRQITVPHPRGASSSELGGLACSDAAHCMAVGNYTNSAGRFLPFAVRWDSGRWRLLATPAVRNQHQTIFEGISCPTASKCVAVGNTVDNTAGKFYHAFAEVWSGGKWHVSTLRQAPSVFIGASCPAADRCFASGYTFPSIRGYAHQLIETWNGSNWTTQSPAQTARLAGSLPHVSCVSSVACEAAGYAFYPSTPNNAEAITEVWNGHRWLGQVTPNP